ncbi:MAG TPA: shikimate dehydrogenase [Burkholderiales bacterium]|nr:shikimate dehydrogenase [Burkholderiales bacterium]
MSDRYAVIGNPVAHSKSPAIHAEFARATGENIQYGLIEAPLDGFAREVEQFRAAGGKGVNVTLPFKQEACRLSARLSERARIAQAVNTMRFADSFGDNTDGVGLVRDIAQNLEYDLGNRSVLLLGAGGAARGVIGALLEAGAARLAVANRTLSKARALAERFPGILPLGYDALAEERFDVVINATSAGLAGAAPPLPEGLLGRSVLAYDMVYGRDTPFLAAARRAGARACDGLGMLVEQAAESFFIWRGVRPATRPVLAKLRGS